jgi:hypothetical protein
MTDEIQQKAADAATEIAIDAHIAGDKEKAAPLFKAAGAAHERAALSEQTGSDPAWRDGNDVAPLAPMPDAPAVTSETDAAVEKLNDMGGRHADLVQAWGSDAPVNIEYARAAFRDVVATNPDLIAAFDANGLGDHPAILEHLARHGRLNAGLMGDHTIANRRNIDVTHSPIRPDGKPRAASSAQNEMTELMEANPPGTAGYKSPRIQQRIEALSRMIAGSGNAVGIGGRNA